MNQEGQKIDYASEQWQSLLTEAGMRFKFNKTSNPLLIYPLAGAGGQDATEDKTLFAMFLGEKGRIELVEKEKVMKSIALSAVVEIRDETSNGFGVVYAVKEKGKSKAFLAKFAFQSKRDCEDVVFLLKKMKASGNALSFRLKYSQLQLHEGPLGKRGKSKKYADRYCRLLSNRILVYRTRSSTYPVNVFTLDNTEDYKEQGMAPECFGLMVNELRRSVMFKAANKNEASKWRQIIAEERSGNYIQSTKAMLGERVETKSGELADREKFFCDLLCKGGLFARYDDVPTRSDFNCLVRVSPDFKTLHWGEHSSCPVQDVMSVTQGRQAPGFKANDQTSSSTAVYPAHSFSVALVGTTLDLEIVRANNPKKEAVTWYNAFAWLIHVSNTLRLGGFEQAHNEYAAKIEKYISGGDAQTRRRQELERLRQQEQETKEKQRVQHETRHERAASKAVEEKNKLSERKHEDRWTSSMDASGVWTLSPTVQSLSLLQEKKLAWRFVQPTKSLLLYPIFDLKNHSSSSSDKLLFAIFLNNPARVEILGKEQIIKSIPMTKFLSATNSSEPAALELKYAVGTASLQDKTEHSRIKFLSKKDALEVLNFLRYVLETGNTRLKYGQLVLHEGAASKKGKKKLFANRYLRLLPNRLLIYRNETAPLPVNIISLDGANIRASGENASGEFCVETSGAGGSQAENTIFFKCPDTLDYRSWCDALNLERANSNLVYTLADQIGQSDYHISPDELDDSGAYFVKLLSDGADVKLYDQDGGPPLSVSLKVGNNFKSVTWDRQNAPANELDKVVFGNEGKGFVQYTTFENIQLENSKCLSIYFKMGRELHVECSDATIAKALYRGFLYMKYVSRVLAETSDINLQQDILEKIRQCIKAGGIEKEEEVKTAAPTTTTTSTQPTHQRPPSLSSAPQPLSSGGARPPSLSTLSSTNNAPAPLTTSTGPPMLSSGGGGGRPPSLSTLNNAAPAPLSSNTSGRPPSLSTLSSSNNTLAPLTTSTGPPMLSSGGGGRPPSLSQLNSQPPAQAAAAPVEQKKRASIAPDTYYADTMHIGELLKALFPTKDLQKYADIFDEQMYDTVAALREDTEWHDFKDTFKIPAKIFAKIKAAV